MDPAQPAGSRRRTIAIIAAAGLACLAIAIPVSGAFGADESPNSGTAAQQQQGYGQPGNGQGYGQPPAPNGQGQPPSGAPNGDCPEGEQGQQGQPPQSGGSSGSDSSGYALPGDSVPS
jgi:hypothetical protein